MKKLTLLITCLLSLPFGLISQESQQEIIRIVGRLTDKQTREPVAFANIGVVNSYIGAASNIDGYFEVKIPSKYKERELQISAVGYSSFKRSLIECMTIDSLLIELTPRNYNIAEVEVKAQSLVLHRTLKNAIDRIPQNYLQTPFNYDTYYRSERWENDSLNRLREAAIEIYDKKGYQRSDAYKVFKERGYRFLQVRKNFETTTLAQGSTYLDELLEMDIVRVRGNILNKDHLDLYDLKLEKITEYENDSIWVIAYKSKLPMLSNTGDYYAKSYQGKIYIKMKDFAVVKNETQVTASNYSSQGRSFYVNEERQEWIPETIKYNYSVTYKQHQDYYYLSYVNYNRHHQLIHKETGTSKKLNIISEMLVTRIRTIDPTPIEKRAYYEDMPYNKEFWDSYNILFDVKE